MALGLLETNGTTSVRERELATGRLVLRAVAGSHPFVVRRAELAVGGLEPSPARRALARATGAAAAGDRSEMISALLAYGTVLERHCEYAGAAEVYGAVLSADPGDVLAALHTARAVRKAGRREEAAQLYRQAGSVASSRSIDLMVRIGEALVSDHPQAGLTEALGAARRAGAAESMAVAREERSRFLLAAGRTGAAVRDLGAAAARYPARVDRVRVLHRMAEILLARGDAPAAREALLCALDHVSDHQRGHTVQRLRTLARSMGDELELRRSRGRSLPGLVTLTPSRLRAPAGRSSVRYVRRLRDAIAAGASRQPDPGIVAASTAPGTT